MKAGDQNGLAKATTAAATTAHRLRGGYGNFWRRGKIEARAPRRGNTPPGAHARQLKGLVYVATMMIEASDRRQVAEWAGSLDRSDNVGTDCRSTMVVNGEISNHVVVSVVRRSELEEVGEMVCPIAVSPLTDGFVAGGELSL